jgi:DNA-binding transcriptional ArsR family regulator
MEMRQRLLLGRLDQVRALADPLRLRLVHALVASELTVAGMSRAVKAPVTRLYHHVDRLVAAGLIEVTRRVRRRGAEERFYRATARRFELEGSLLERAPDRDRSIDDLVDLARSVLGGALEELTDGLRSGRVAPSRRGRGMLLEVRRLRLTADGLDALRAELPRWVDDFVRRHGSARGGAVHLAVAAFPTIGRSQRTTVREATLTEEG